MYGWDHGMYVYSSKDRQTTVIVSNCLNACQYKESTLLKQANIQVHYVNRAESYKKGI